MGVKTKYPGVKKTQSGWMIDIRLKMPDGTIKRLRKDGFESQAKAAAAAGKLKAEALEGRYFDRERSTALSVEQAWELFRPSAEESHKSFRSTRSRAKLLIRHLGKKNAGTLTHADIVKYRKLRKEEETYRHRTPSNATLNREISLLRRILNYAVDCRRLRFNPLARVQMLKESNIRNVDIPDDEVNAIIDAAEEPLRTFLYVARDTGMRKTSIPQIAATSARFLPKTRGNQAVERRCQTQSGRICPQTSS